MTFCDLSSAKALPPGEGREKTYVVPGMHRRTSQDRMSSLLPQTAPLLQDRIVSPFPRTSSSQEKIPLSMAQNHSTSQERAFVRHCASQDKMLHINSQVVGTLPKQHLNERVPGSLPRSHRSHEKIAASLPRSHPSSEKMFFMPRGPPKSTSDERMLPRSHSSQERMSACHISPGHTRPRRLSEAGL